MTGRKGRKIRKRRKGKKRERRKRTEGKKSIKRKWRKERERGVGVGWQNKGGQGKEDTDDRELKRRGEMRKGEKGPTEGT